MELAGEGAAGSEYHAIGNPCSSQGVGGRNGVPPSFVSDRLHAKAAIWTGAAIRLLHQRHGTET